MVLFKSLNKQSVMHAYDHLVNKSGWIDNPRQRFILEDLNERVHGWFIPAVPFYYIWGSVGSGKTTIINILFDYFKGKKERWHYSDLVHYLSNYVMQDIKSPKDWKKYVKKQFKRGQILCIDEWVLEDVTQIMLWKSFLPALWARGVYVVVTSNTPVDEIYQNGLGREHFLSTIEMIKHNGYIYDLIDTVDYRLKNKVNFTSPFVGGNAEFLALKIAPQLSQSPILPGENEIIFSTKDLLCIDFEKAITPPVWRKDYIQWATNYNTILIQGVYADIKNKNQLVNWVRLVDLLYDEGVFVFLTIDCSSSQTNKLVSTWPERTKSRVESWINHQNLWAQQNL